jgi:hypothetical protein
MAREPIPLIEHEYVPLSVWPSMNDVEVVKITPVTHNGILSRHMVFYTYRLDYTKKVMGGYIAVWDGPDELAAYTMFTQLLRKHGAQQKD